MKSVKMFGKSVPLLAIVIASMLAIGAGAALLTYYGTITSTVAVAQSLKLDGFSWDDSAVTESVGGTAGETIPGDWHYLENMADKVILFSIASSETNWPTGGQFGLKEVYPELELDATVDDDAFRLILAGDVLFGDITGISFDCLIVSDTWETLKAGPYPELTGPWIPQINIRLLDNEGNFGYYASWNSFRSGITGTVGAQASITFDKDDFFLYDSGWGSLGLYKALDGPTKALVDACKFGIFSHQAGDTSVDPNSGSDPGGQPYWPAKSSQVVLVSNHVVEGGPAIVGMGLFPDATLERLDFRMMYVFEDAAIPGTYTVTTTISPYP